MDEQRAWIARPQGPAQFHDCIGAVDATYVRIERPKIYADERRLFSFYKKYHAVFFMCVVDRRGTDEHTACSVRGDVSAPAHHSCLLSCVPRSLSLRGLGQPAQGMQ